MALEAAVLEAWGDAGIHSVGIYNCRRIAGSDAWSLHAEGRAVDLSVLRADAGAGYAVLAMLLGAADYVLQRILWDHNVYDVASPLGRPLQGNPHTDHLHVELSWPAARQEIPLGLTVEQLLPEDEAMPNLITAWRGAQWVVAADLSSKQGLAQGADVAALLKVQEGRAYVATTLTDSLMSKIPVVPSA